MKLYRILAIAAIALGVSACGVMKGTATAENQQAAEPEATTVSPASSGTTVNAANGIAVGKALLALYTQYKTDGKLDISNPTTIASIVSLISNIKGIRSDATPSNTPSSFVQGLVTGSSNLVTKGNTPSVLSTLGSISNLDVSALANNALSSATTAATSAASSYLSSALSSLAGSASTAATTAAAAATAEQEAATANAASALSALTGLFGMFK